MPSIHSFHIVLMDGTERDIKAGAVECQGAGALAVLREDTNELKVLYAPGVWKYVEPEAQDDRG